ncbi:hypothetical protein Q5H91_07345 [Sphingomonas sp. KR1UV-12]|uniref:Uncharacterized protein n=1 Tax=Sphingomonas aurea TaxID=3063994 RepID=A0ABT9EJA8_9SPHN|nr:hypothetical protein [Sphingomonas sp. KR1UV-12]MDP1027021.1 hypothetical protein [Sphingomonas sp. KR1UV-12]
MTRDITHLLFTVRLAIEPKKSLASSLGLQKEQRSSHGLRFYSTYGLCIKPVLAKELHQPDRSTIPSRLPAFKQEGGIELWIKPIHSTA